MDNEQERVTIRRSAPNVLGAEVATHDGASIDDELLAETLGQVLCNQAADDIGRAPCRKSDDEFDRPCRIVERPGDARFFFSSRRRHTRCLSDWSSDVCSSD